MQYYLLVRCLIALLFGYVIGGYTNTLEYRLRVQERTVTKGCFCPHCGRTLLQRDQIPIISYLILRGKCRYCKSSIGIHYPLVEALIMIIYGVIALLTKTNNMPVVVGGMLSVYMYVYITLIVRKSLKFSVHHITGFLLMCVYHMFIFIGLEIVNIGML